jgi:hypothetical protein
MEYNFKPKYRLGRVTNKYHILEILFFSFYRQRGFKHLFKASRSLRQLLIENFTAALAMSDDAFSHIKDFPSTISQVDLPESDIPISFVLLSGDFLYTECNKTLHVYSLTDLSWPLATYALHRHCFSGIIADNRLYLGGGYKNLLVYEVTESLEQPLKPLKVIYTEGEVQKIKRHGQQLIMGDSKGFMSIVDIKDSKITHSHVFFEGKDGIRDLVSINETQYLLATSKGLLKTSKDLILTRHIKRKSISSLCHVTDSIYLMGLHKKNKLVVWNE